MFQQLPTEVYWSVQETDKNNKDWTRENTFTYPGTEAPSWFTFEFLRGKLLTIKTNTTRDYLFSGFSKHEKGKLGTRGMSLNFTSDDEKQFIIETIVGQDDEVYLVLTPSLMTSLGMGNLTTDFEGRNSISLMKIILNRGGRKLAPMLLLCVMIDKKILQINVFLEYYHE